MVWIPLPEGLAFDDVPPPPADEDHAATPLWHRLSGAWLRLCRHSKTA